MNKAILTAAGMVALAALCPADANAQFYKGKTITMIVNYPAGGPTDTEARIVTHYLPAHIPGNPTIIVRNVGGAGGIIGTNQLSEASPDGETIGFATINVLADALEDPALRVSYSDFVMIAGIESPLVVYMRKDVPPGIKSAADLMKAKEFRALSLGARNSNTINQLLALDLLGVKYQAIPGFRGLRDVETAILQDTGQMANTSLSGWRASVEPQMGDIVTPLWQLSPRAADGTYPRHKALPNIPTFEEVYAKIHPGKTLPGQLPYDAMRTIQDAQLATFRIAMMPPKASPEALKILRAAFDQLWTDEKFLKAYAKSVHTQPTPVKGAQAQEILAKATSIGPRVRDFLANYTDNIVKKKAPEKAP